MQLGYHALEVQEDKDTRMSRLAPYIRSLTGQEPDSSAMAAFLVDVEEMGLILCKGVYSSTLEALHRSTLTSDSPCPTNRHEDPARRA